MAAEKAFKSFNDWFDDEPRRQPSAEGGKFSTVISLLAIAGLITEFLWVFILGRPYYLREIAALPQPDSLPSQTISAMDQKFLSDHNRNLVTISGYIDRQESSVVSLPVYHEDAPWYPQSWSATTYRDVEVILYRVYDDTSQSGDFVLVAVYDNDPFGTLEEVFDSGQDSGTARIRIDGQIAEDQYTGTWLLIKQGQASRL